MMPGCNCELGPKVVETNQSRLKEVRWNFFLTKLGPTSEIPADLQVTNELIQFFLF